MREDAEYRREYETLEEKISLIAAMLDARQNAGLTQAQVAERMGVKQTRGGEDRRRSAKRLHRPLEALRPRHRMQDKG